MSNQFFSSLVISGRKYPNVHQVFRPRFNKEFFKRILANADHLEEYMKKRSPQRSCQLNYDISRLKDDSKEFLKLKEKLERVETSIKAEDERVTNPERDEITTKLESVQDRLMPFVVALPNRASKNVSLDEEVILHQVESELNAKKENLQKVLNHVKLSYINNCHSKSVVGPNSCYYYGIGAKLQQGLSDFFTSELENRQHIQLSGLCLTKSAVVEATNSSDLKHYMTDPCRILTQDLSYTTLHLVEASREAMVGFWTTLGPTTSNKPLRLMMSGSGYRSGTELDSDSRRVAQFETLHALTICPSIEAYSMKEYNETRAHIWNIYKALKLPTRLVQCSLASMYANEYDASRVDIWLPSLEKWVQVARVSHYLDHPTVRTGMKRGHLVDSTVFDGQALFVAILENNQTSNGRFIIPNVIKKFMPSLSSTEIADYFREIATNQQENDRAYPAGSSGVLNNYSQKRHLVRKSYDYGHSKKTREETGMYFQGTLASLCLLLFMGCLIDWEEVWVRYVPRSVQRFLHDYLYRIPLKVWHYMACRNSKYPPKDLSYDEKDWSWMDVPIVERRKAAMEDARRKG